MSNNWTFQGASQAAGILTVPTVGSYPAPVTCTDIGSVAAIKGSHRWRTVISFLVRVPVLSVQMTVVALKASTAERRLTRALRRTIRRTPIASARVTVGNRPSGTSATIMPIAKIKLSLISMPTSREVSTKTRLPMVRAIAVITRTIWVTCTSRVLGSRLTTVVRWATWPNSVCAPVAYTTATPRPEATVEPANTRLAISAGLTDSCRICSPGRVRICSPRTGTACRSRIG